MALPRAAAQAVGGARLAAADPPASAAHSQRGAARRPTLGGDIDVLASDEQDGSMRDALQRALDRLDVRFKVPFLLVFLEGLTCQETADELGLPLGTVLSRIHRARVALRASLDEPADPRKVVRLDDVPRAQGRRPWQQAELSDEVVAALAALPSHSRELVELGDLGGRPYKDGAHRLGVPLGTVMSRLHHARRIMRQDLGAIARTYGLSDVPAAA